MSHPYRHMEPTHIEPDPHNRMCAHCRFRHHPGVDFVAYDGTRCYAADRIAASMRDLWDGTVSANVMHVGSPTRLVVSKNGNIYNRDTYERVYLRPMRDLIREKRRA